MRHLRQTRHMQIENKPGESARLHKAVVNAFRAHWQAHSNKYPKKLVIPPIQERLLAGYLDPQWNPPGTYWGATIEIDHASSGVMIAIDGTVMPFADYDEKPT